MVVYVSRDEYGVEELMKHLNGWRLNIQATTIVQN